MCNLNNTEKWREEFEAWMFEIGYRDFSRIQGTVYFNTSLDTRWEGWRAAKQSDAARIERMEKALNRIASWDDGPAVGPNFDEPASAEIARAALENKQ